MQANTKDKPMPVTSPEDYTDNLYVVWHLLAILLLGSSNGYWDVSGISLSDCQYQIG